MPDIAKLFEKAEKNLQKQKFEAALENYLEIFRYQPNDLDTLVILGDLNFKLNRLPDGLKFLSQLIDQYIKRNDFPKAIATCRKLLKISPQDLATVLKLANLLEKSKKLGDSLDAYREALVLSKRVGAGSSTLECLQHITVLDPKNLEAHLELAEMAAGSNQPQLASSVYLKAAHLAREASKQDLWAEYTEKAHALNRKDEGASMAVSEVYLSKSRASEVPPLLEPIAENRPDDLTIVELLVRSYTALGQYEKAEPMAWKLYQASPDTLKLVVAVMEGYAKTAKTHQALNLASRLKAPLLKEGKRKEFLSLMERIYEADESSIELLEELVGLYNEMNKEDGLRRSLVRIFNLYLGAERYDKAADTLERILDVEPYGQGHNDRLLNLEGHISPVLYKSIQSRLNPTSAPRGPLGAVQDGAAAAKQDKVESLDALIVEGEMYLQYQLSTKLQETLQTINQLYVGAEENNPRLRELYDNSGFVPKPPPAPLAPLAGLGSAGLAPAAMTAESLEELRRISEITASVHHAASPQEVIQVTVDEIGRALNASRCWGAIASPDRLPSTVIEYCSPSTPPSDPAAAMSLYLALIPQASTKPDGWSINDVAQSPVLAFVQADARTLGIKSLLAIPLLDKLSAVGIILVEQCDRQRAWTPGNSLLLKAISTQVVIAVNSTKLRRLVQSLAGTDEETGLLPRSSYLDRLLAEAHRAKQNSQPLSLSLVEPEDPAALARKLGDEGLQNYMQAVSKLVSSNLRPSDIPVRYNPCAIAIVFPDTPLDQCGATVERLRRELSDLKTNGMPQPTYYASVCDVQLGTGFDAVDGVTEVINRLEATLDMARKEKSKQVLVSKFDG
jgi:GAF domain-containing protein